MTGPKAESSADVSESGIVVYAAIKRESHGRTIAQLEAHEDPPHPGPEASFSERMLHRTATAAGRALYKLRQQTIEPIFGIIKEALGFRRFLLRGLDKVSLKWELVCLAYNFKRLHRLNAQLRPAKPRQHRINPVRKSPKPTPNHLNSAGLSPEP